MADLAIHHFGKVGSLEEVAFNYENVRFHAMATVGREAGSHREALFTASALTFR
jgi:hypothetical protein